MIIKGTKAVEEATKDGMSLKEQMSSAMAFFSFAGMSARGDTVVTGLSDCTAS